jgi:hypothetical protein
VATSCSSDDDSSSSSSELVGKWEYSQEGEIVNGVETLMPYEHAEGCSKDFFQFLANGTGNDTSYFGEDCQEFSFPLTWARSGNIVTLNILGISVPAEILTLNATTLKVKYTDEDGTFVDVYTKVN